MKKFDQKTVIITGGSYGLGRASSIAFAREGANVVVADIDVKKGEETIQKIIEAGGTATFIKTDVSKEADVKFLVNEAVRLYGGLDYAVNNAGITHTAAPVTELKEKLFDTIINTNVKGVWLGMKYEIPELLKRGGGAIVNVSSAWDQTAAPGVAFYVASKHAINGLTKSAALEFIRKGIRINAVSPGGIRTGMVEEFARVNPDLMKLTEESHPIGRIAEPEDIADVVLFLCSDEARFVVGHSLKADGGYVIQ